MATKVAKHQTIYVWEGKNKRGKRTKGEINASSIALVKAELRRIGITPIKVRKKSFPLFSRKKQKIKPADIAIFSRQMATMLSAGIPLVQSLDVVRRGHMNVTMQQLIQELRNQVESGSSFTEALSNHPKHFNELYCSLVDAGEQSGSLEIMLDKIASYQERIESIKGKIKKALFYPIAVLVVAVIVTAALLLFVIPQFESLFKGFGAELPIMTRLVIDLSRLFQRTWWALFFLLFLGSWGFLLMRKRSRRFVHTLDRLILRLPIFGKIFRKAAIARFSRTLAITFAAGLPLVDALKSVAGTTGNVTFSEGTHRIREDVATGQQLQLAMRDTTLFPNMVLQMVAIGEESGSLENMLSKVADFYEEDVNNAVDSLSSLLEPIIMVILGVLIGGLVIAMYLPIFKLGSVV